MKLAVFDLDGTLFDTKDVNYHAYKEALAQYGFSIDYEYYCDFCNGKHYTDFLPQITGADEKILSSIHKEKKKLYAQHLDKAIINGALFQILRLLKSQCKTAVVTTASYQNCMDILNTFHVADLFDLILTHDDIEKSKPDPEGFVKAMEYFGVMPNETVIFEDSDVGLEAAKRSGAYFYKTYGFN